jgi:tetratricopeptide (TPR) repeat protein
MAYTGLKNWAEAEACFARALEQWRTNSDTWNIANTLGELAGLHLARGDWSQARDCLDEAWGLAQDGIGGQYDSLRRELVAHRQELRRLMGLEQTGTR